MAREDRIGVSITEHERAVLAACITHGGYVEPSAVLRAMGVAGARELLARIAPAKLADIDRRFGGGQ